MRSAVDRAISDHIAPSPSTRVSIEHSDRQARPLAELCGSQPAEPGADHDDIWFSFHASSTEKEPGS
jgi:hypothetical protein